MKKTLYSEYGKKRKTRERSENVIVPVLTSIQSICVVGNLVPGDSALTEKEETYADWDIERGTSDD